MAKYDEIIKYKDHIISRNIVQVLSIAIWTIFIVEHVCFGYQKVKIYLKSKCYIPMLIGGYTDYIRRKKTLKHVCNPYYGCCASSRYYITTSLIIMRVVYMQFLYHSDWLKCYCILALIEKQNHHSHCKSTQQNTSFISGHVYHSKMLTQQNLFWLFISHYISTSEKTNILFPSSPSHYAFMGKLHSNFWIYKCGQIYNIALYEKRK